MFEALQAEIKTGCIALGAYLPSEKMLEVRLGVSRSTVRRALDQLVASGWAVRDPHRGVRAGQGPPKPRQSIIALVDYNDAVHKSLFFYLSQYLATSGLHLVHVDSTRIGTLAALEKAIAQGFAAAVFWGKEFCLDEARLNAIRRKMPVVAVDHSPNGVKVDVVRGDHTGGAEQAALHLLNHGRTQVAISGFLTLPEDCQMRLLGYALAHFKAGKPFRAHNIVYSSTVSEPAFDVPRLLKQRLSEPDRPDALFVMHDISVPPMPRSLSLQA